MKRARLELHLRGALLVVAVGGLLAGVAIAEEPVAPPTEKAAPPAAAEPSLDGMVTGYSSDRGFYQLDTEQARQILDAFREQLASRPAEAPFPALEPRALEPRLMPNGMIRQRLPLHLLSTSYVRVAPDGSLVEDCAEDPATARRLSQQPVDDQSGEVLQ